MKIREISVTQLFDLFNHKIQLNTEERITLVHGPNGFGKTVILRMLDGLFSNNYIIFRDVPFKRFQIRFDDDSRLWVQKQSQNGREFNRVELSCYFEAEPDARPQRFNLLPGENSLDQRSVKADYLSFIEVSISGMQRVDERIWLYHPTNEYLSLSEILARFGREFPQSVYEILSKMDDTPAWFSRIKEQIPVHFIRTQRLESGVQPPTKSRASRNDPNETILPSVTKYSRELARTIQSKLAESGEISQSLDRTFPNRLLEQISQGIKPRIGRDEIREELENLEEKRSRLVTAGLLDKVEEKVEVPETFSRGKGIDNVLSIYVDDNKEKLNVFTEMLNKIELMKKIIEERFLYKRMVINKEDGIKFLTPKGEYISPTDLSSGEQHELILLYELLFKVKPNSLILIDEPELSLHVAWQQQFLRDLMEIIGLANFDALIATHSPQIIHDRWDLTVGLKGPKNDRSL